MKKSIFTLAIIGILITIGILAFNGITKADIPSWFEYIIVYDGYVERHSAGGMPLFTADTLFVINNTDPTDSMLVWVEVFDKKGNLVWEGEVWDGGQPVTQVVSNGFGWFTLGMILNIVNRDTVDPFGNRAAEKFFVRISAAHKASKYKLVPTVEVKQVLYDGEIDYPEFAVWQPKLIRSWSEAALGGSKNTTGVIFPY